MHCPWWQGEDWQSLMLVSQWVPVKPINEKVIIYASIKTYKMHKT